jgi:hypothetical protein
MYFTQVLDAVHRIQWKPVFLLTICLMALHTLVFQGIEPGVGVEESPMTSSPPKTKPNSVPLTDIQGDNDPLVVEGPEDHDFPPDGAPSAYIAVVGELGSKAFEDVSRAVAHAFALKILLSHSGRSNY